MLSLGQSQMKVASTPAYKTNLLLNNHLVEMGMDSGASLLVTSGHIRIELNNS